MISFFYFLSHRGIWIVSVVSLLISTLTYLIFDGVFIRHTAISFGYGFACYTVNTVAKGLFPRWSHLKHYATSSMIGILFGTINALLWVKGYGIGPEWQKFIPIVVLAILFSGAISFLFYLKGQAVSLEGQLDRSKLVSADLEKRLALSELKLLQSQVDPHFLYYTLSDMHQLIAKDPDLACHLTTRLTDLLRVSMPINHDKCTTLTNEVALLDTYLSIHELRTQGRFSYSIDIDECLSPHYVLPPNLIQPIVEHAVLHGRGLNIEEGELAISFRRNSDELEVVVAGNSSGLQLLMTPEEEHHLVKIQGHLSQLFGDKGSFEIKALDQGHTRIRLAWDYEG